MSKHDDCNANKRVFNSKNKLEDSELGVYDFNILYNLGKGASGKAFIPRRSYGLGYANASYSSNYDPTCEKIVDKDSFKYIINDKNKEICLLNTSTGEIYQTKNTIDKSTIIDVKNNHESEESENIKIKNYKSRIKKLKSELKDEKERSCQLSILLNKKTIELESVKKAPNMKCAGLDARLRKEIIEKDKLSTKIEELNVELDKLTDENCKLINKEKLWVESQNNASIKKSIDYITGKHNNDYKIKVVEVPKIIKTFVEVIKEVEIVKEVEVIKKVHRRNLTIVLSVVSLILGSFISGLVYHSIYLNKENSLIDEYEKQIDGYKKMLKVKNKSKKVNE